MASTGKDGDAIKGDQNKVEIHGDVHGGTILAGNYNTLNVGAPGAGGVTLEQVRAQVAAMLLLVPTLEGNLRLTAEGTLKTSAEELQKPKPGLAAAVNNLTLLLSLLPAAAAASEAAQKLRPMLEQAVAWLQQLVK